MKTFRWPADKNESLLSERGVGFEHMVIAIESGGLLDLLAHPNQQRYPNPRIFVIRHDGYVFLVPFVEEDTHYFLKTIIPSRKARRMYLQDKGDAS